jgi:hypothetical protein
MTVLDMERRPCLMATARSGCRHQRDALPHLIYPGVYRCGVACPSDWLTAMARPQWKLRSHHLP